MTSNDSFPANVTWSPVDSNETGVGDAGPGRFSQQWHVYLEAAFLGLVCLLGVLGNLAACSNAASMRHYARHNSVIATSLSASDLLICLLRGPAIIYVLITAESKGGGGAAVCEVWVFSTMLVLVSVVTNMVVAIERYIIVHSFHKYVQCFTARHMAALFVTLWAGTAASFSAVYLGLGYQATVLPATRSCTVTSSAVTPATSLAVCVAAVTVFGVLPLGVLTFCYVSIVTNICQAGLLKLDKLEEKANYSKVTCISCARTVLALSCWTPWLVCVVLGPLYPGVLLDNLHYMDYILVIEAAVCPVLTMQDNDFRESYSRRKSRYFKVFLGAKEKRENGSARRSNISSADMKTM